MSDEKPRIVEDAGGDRIVPPAPSAPVNLPAVVEASAPEPRRRRSGRPLVWLLLLAAAAGGGIYWWRHTQPGLPPGIAWSNGRLEADEVDIDTKFAGRIAKLFVGEGDMV